MFSNIMRVIFNPNNNFIIIIIIIFFLPMDWREYRVRLKHGIMVQYPPPQKKKPKKQKKQNKKFLWSDTVTNKSLHYVDLC